MKHLPIWPDANWLLLEIEQAVRAFPRYHKYTAGKDLCRQAMGIVRLISRAYLGEGERHRQVRRLVLAVDDIKVLIHLAKELRAFANFAQFQRISGLAVSVRKQSGSWCKKTAPRRSPGNRV